jgi:6-pyruvoyltetrahydropterin/6-carboxytetrahydropterin synthase
MFKLRKNFRFEASHQLMHHDGKCARLHGHSWTGYIEVGGMELQTSGPQKNMLIDYYHLGKITKAIENMFDHQHLNDILQSEMPTSELLAGAIYLAHRGDIVPPLRLTRVVINETCSSQCTYEP